MLCQQNADATRAVERSVAELRASMDKMQQRLDEIERERELDALVAFYCTIPKVQLDLDEVVVRCEDPSYNQFVFCHRQLPVLLARMIRSIDTFPLGLNTMPSIRKVRRIFANSFYTLHSCELPVTAESEKTFYEEVENRDEAHDPVLMTMANGVLELKHSLFRHKKAIYSLTDSQSGKPSSSNPKDHQRIQDIFEKKKSAKAPDSPATKRAIYDDMAKIQGPLDEFNTTFVEYRFISRQMLQTMRARVHGVKPNPEADDDFLVSEEAKVGMVTKDLDLVKLVRTAVHNAKQLCETHYGDTPDVDVVVVQAKDRNGAPPVKIAHLSDQIHYILFELLKNSLRATVDQHMKRNSSGIVTCTDMPPVKVLVSLREDSDEAVLCVSDQGGGIRREDMAKVMNYTYTTSAKPVLESDGESADEPTPLAGFGYGLPLSRIYARSFGGDVYLHSVEGFGTKAFLHLKKKAKLEMPI